MIVLRNQRWRQELPVRQQLLGHLLIPWYLRHPIKAQYKITASSIANVHAASSVVWYASRLGTRPLRAMQQAPVIQGVDRSTIHWIDSHYSLDNSINFDCTNPRHSNLYSGYTADGTIHSLRNLGQESPKTWWLLARRRSGDQATYGRMRVNL